MNSNVNFLPGISDILCLSPFCDIFLPVIALSSSIVLTFEVDHAMAILVIRRIGKPSKAKLITSLRSELSIRRQNQPAIMGVEVVG